MMVAPTPTYSTKRLAARLAWGMHRHCGLEAIAALMGISVGGLHKLIKPLIPFHDAGDVHGLRDAVQQIWIAETDGSGIGWDIAYLGASCMIAERCEAFKRTFANPGASHVAA